MQDVARDIATYVISFNMSDYGARTKKPTKLYSDAEWVEQFAHSETYVDVMPNIEAPQTFLKYFDSAGKPKVQGGRELKGTQEYTRRFGQEVRRIWRTNCRSGMIRPEVDQEPEALKELLHMGPGAQGVRTRYANKWQLTRAPLIIYTSTYVASFICIEIYYILLSGYGYMHMYIVLSGGWSTEDLLIIKQLVAHNTKKYHAACAHDWAIEMSSVYS